MISLPRDGISQQNIQYLKSRPHPTNAHPLTRLPMVGWFLGEVVMGSGWFKGENRQSIPV